MQYEERELTIYLLILITLLPITNQFKCDPLMKTCICLSSKTTTDDFYLNCQEANIKYKENRLLTITCNGNQNNTAEIIPNYDFLPKLSTELDKIGIERCNLKNNSINNFLKLMEVPKIRNLVMKNNFDVKLNANYFNSTSQHLFNLSILKCNISNIDSNIFANMNQLTILNLSNNKITLVDDQFKELINLTDLDLSCNDMLELPKNAFKNLHMLKKLDLYSNNITELDENVFSDLFKLDSLQLSSNRISHLSENVFSNMIKLTKLNLGANNLTSLPAGIFKNNILLTSIRLERNNITSIPDQLFDGLYNLQKLWLQKNQLTYISHNIFKNSIALLELRLDNNLIHQNISGKLLSQAKQLTKFQINNNKIEALDLTAFNNNKNLIEINLSNNKINMDESLNGLGPFNNCINLKKLNLANNLISFIVMPSLHTEMLTLDMSYNKITSVDISMMLIFENINLSNNLISEVNLHMVENYIRNNQSSKINLNNNPINCDCQSYDLLRYFNKTIESIVLNSIDITADNLYCTNFANVSVKSVLPSTVTCDVNECPKNCSCVYRPYKSAYVIDCSGRNLSQVPIIGNARILTYKGNASWILQSLDKNFKDGRIEPRVGMIEVYLQNNILTQFPMKGWGNEYVKILNISKNYIRNITWIPSNLEVLNLDNNRIQRLNNNILSKFNNTVTLHENPLICDCDALNLTYFIKEHPIMFKTNIRCNGNGIELKRLTKQDLCPTSTTLILSLTIAMAIVIALIAILIAFYYKYNQKIKIWVFVHGVCRCLISEEDLDKDKTYDAFLSFSHVDDEFVIKELLPNLESGPSPYKLCIHVRDWVPGEYIINQIAESVSNSRCTIIVLSPSFLDSMYGLTEFREAHMQTLTEKRNKLIIILYGDIDLESDKIDNEMKLYLKTNTYIKWGDSWFWDKLKYALRHKKDKHVGANVDNRPLLSNGSVVETNV